MEFQIQPIKRDIVIDGFNSIYYFEFGKNFTHPPEKHNFWEIVYVDSGEIIAVTDGLAKTLTQGQVIFHRPGEVHAHVSDNKVANSMLVVSFTTKSKLMDSFNKKIFTLDKTGKMLLTLFIKEAEIALGRIPGEYDNKNALDFSESPLCSSQLLECYLTEFLLILSRYEDSKKAFHGGKISRQLAQSSTIELITEYMKNNIYENLSLNDICTKFFIGKSNLCKLFSEHIGKGPIEYYSTLKINEAKRLLADDNITVSKISDMLGYSSIHNFSRAFKKAVGCSPVEYSNKINLP